MRMRPVIAISFLVLTMVGAAAKPKADDKAKADAKARAEKGNTHYKLGRFDDALAEYSAAYEIYPAPGLLFNIGQCHKNLKHYERAVFFFEGYLREKPNAPNRALVE